MATGERSGVWVLDVDGADGERALAELECEHGPLPEWYPMQWTGSGRGWQAFFEWPDSHIIRNSAGQLGQHIDVRGRGGYVLLPPSVHPSGNEYRWATDRSPWNIPPEPPPGWLLELLDPPKPRRVTHEAPVAPNAYLRRALEQELSAVATAASGSRNDTLHKAAFSLFRFASSGEIPADRLASALAAAAADAGLPEKESQATINSAARARGV